MSRTSCVCCRKPLNTMPYCCHGARILQLRAQVAFSERFIADKSKPLEHRILEKKALKARRLSLALLGPVAL